MGKMAYRIRCVKRIVGAFSAFCVFVGGVNVLNYVYVQPEDWCHVLWHNYYEDQQNIDNLYLGSSHTYHSLNPAILDELNGQHNFNLATPSQPIKESYYLLREAGQDNKLGHVYLELFYAINTDVYNQQSYAGGYGWKNCFEMKLSVNKLLYMFSHPKKEQYIENGLVFLKYRSKLDDWDYIKEQMAHKMQEYYLNYQYYYEDERGYIEYQKAGYYCSTRELLSSERLYYQNRNLKCDLVSAVTKEYLGKIIEYCQRKDIPITLFVAPMDHLALISTQDYDNYIEQIKEIAEKYNVPFYDFNVTKEEYLPIWSDQNFNDIAHLSDFGSKMFTPFFYTVVSGNHADNEMYFYDSYAEKLSQECPTIYGIYYKDAIVSKEDSEPVRTMWIASNREEGMEYRIILTPEEGEQYIIQDFGENRKFTIPVEEKGFCTITARVKETQEEVKTLDINY